MIRCNPVTVPATTVPATTVPATTVPGHYRPGPLPSRPLRNLTLAKRKLAKYTLANEPRNPDVNNLNQVGPRYEFPLVKRQKYPWGLWNVRGRVKKPCQEVKPRWKQPIWQIQRLEPNLLDFPRWELVVPEFDAIPLCIFPTKEVAGACWKIVARLVLTPAVKNISSLFALGLRFLDNLNNSSVHSLTVPRFLPAHSTPSPIHYRTTFPNSFIHLLTVLHFPTPSSIHLPYSISQLLRPFTYQMNISAQSSGSSVAAAVCPPLSWSSPPSSLSFLLSSQMDGMVDQLLEIGGNRTFMAEPQSEPDPDALIHTLRPFCAQNYVSDFAKLLAESLAKRPTRGGEWSRLLLTCIFSAVGLFGFMGNLLTVLVIFRTPSLHSHTNYFLASLAVSDLLLIFVGVSFDIFSLWRRHFNGWTAFSGFCEATSTSISWFTFCSILTIVGLTGHTSTTIWLVGVLWVISFFPSLYIGLQFKTVVRDFCGRTHSNIFGNCDFVGWNSQNGQDHYTFEAQLLITFVFPVIFIFYCYVKILQTLNEATSNSHQLNAAQTKHSDGRANKWQRLNHQQQQVLVVEGPRPRESIPPSLAENWAEQRFGGGPTRSKNASSLTPRRKLTRNSSGRGSIRSQQAHKTVLKMLVTITILFFICYLPYHLERLVVKYAQEYCARVCVLLYPITGLLQYISATLNPIIYNVMSRRFRREFLRIFHKMCGREMTADEDRFGGCHFNQNNGCGRKTPLQMTPLNRLL
uniref:G-protein coupled receptors family 1 profile domain-containing protein n=1 Tax=Globodera rostochiensis TaxID=31243 RepID=A0A914GY15_GLORO